MVVTLEEIAIEAAVIVAVVAAASCFVYLLALTLLERRTLRRLRATRPEPATSTRPPNRPTGPSSPSRDDSLTHS